MYCECLVGSPITPYRKAEPCQPDQPNAETLLLLPVSPVAPTKAQCPVPPTTKDGEAAGDGCKQWKAVKGQWNLRHGCVWQVVSHWSKIKKIKKFISHHIHVPWKQFHLSATATAHAWKLSVASFLLRQTKYIALTSSIPATCLNPYSLPRSQPA